VDTALKAANMRPLCRPRKWAPLGRLARTKSYVLQDDDGQIALTQQHQRRAGLRRVGPEHAWLRDLGRTEYTYATDERSARRYVKLLSRMEGIIPRSKAPTPSPISKTRADYEQRPDYFGQFERARGIKIWDV